MTSTTETQRAYAKGYAAGKRRKLRGAVSAEAQARRDAALWQRAFLAALPFAMTQEGWQRDEKPIREMADRVRLAAEVADQCLTTARARGRA